VTALLPNWRGPLLPTPLPSHVGAGSSGLSLPASTAPLSELSTPWSKYPPNDDAPCSPCSQRRRARSAGSSRVEALLGAGPGAGAPPTRGYDETPRPKPVTDGIPGDSLIATNRRGASCTNEELFWAHRGLRGLCPECVVDNVGSVTRLAPYSHEQMTGGCVTRTSTRRSGHVGRGGAGRACLSFEHASRLQHLRRVCRGIRPEFLVHTKLDVSASEGS
jgi:hypothetical protein